MTGKKVLVALSGGVDSTVCVHLLKEQGYTVAGLVLKMSPAHEDTVKAAQESADSLGIPLYVRDKTADFQQYVIDYFAEEYQNGRTPNPCIICNPTVKFKALADAADELGYDWIATGHYAKLEKQNGEVLLKKGNSAKRDQSYMLYRLNQRILSRLLLPLAELEKDEVRAIAANLGVSAASKPAQPRKLFYRRQRLCRIYRTPLRKINAGRFYITRGSPLRQTQRNHSLYRRTAKGFGNRVGTTLFLFGRSMQKPIAFT